MGFKKLFDSGYKEFKRCSKIAKKVLEIEDKYKDLSDEELQNQTNLFRERLKNGETLNDILVEAYAVCREAAYRVTGMKAFYVQIVGAIAIHGGNIAEMKTGEGKTLTGVFPAYLNALTGDGVHIVTVNEYLAERETAGQIGKIYRFLGLTVGLNLRELTSEQKREVYSCDIVYSTNSELGFDYLRDNMCSSVDQSTRIKVLNYAIIDEADSILIEDARTPLIISGPAKDDNGTYEVADKFVKSLKEDDYDIDIESRTIVLTQSGVEKAERDFKLDNLYDASQGNVTLVHRINNALKANYIFKNGVEYVVQENPETHEGEVLIVDQSTGRILKGRQFSEGLHQALEAKEGVVIKKETVTVATITYQNFFRMYKKLSGMTGTAKTEEEEFRDIYNMYVVEIPTNVPVIRIDAPDVIFLTPQFKFKAIVKEIQERHEKGQPILVGTANVATSELLHSMLEDIHLPHEVLNAKNHAREAEIISHAGEKGAITISTNMAGRGTDIKLGEGVRELGGLCVLGTERFEARRIDNQLRGRAGRQGDPGYSQFFLSAEDDLMNRFGGDSFKNRLASIIRMMNNDEADQPLQSKMIARMVTMAQVKIEGINFDSRKNVLKYDDVIRRQREKFYAQRQQVVKAEALEDVLYSILRQAIENKVLDYIDTTEEFNDKEFTKKFNESYIGTPIIDENVIASYDDDEDITNYIFEECKKFFKTKIDSLENFIRNNVPVPEGLTQEEFISQNTNFFIKRIILPVLDKNWRDHIDDMDGFRQGIYLQSYAQTNPLELYQREGYQKFMAMNRRINEEVMLTAMHVVIRFERKVQEDSNEDEVKKLNTNQDLSRTKSNEPRVNRKDDPFVNVKPNDACPCGSGKKFKFCHGLKR